MPSKKRNVNRRNGPKGVDVTSETPLDESGSADVTRLGSLVDSLTIVDEGADADRGQQLLDGLEVILDNLTDKRAKLRSQALSQLPCLLSRCCGQEYLLANRVETILSAQCQLFKRGVTIQDKVLCCKSLSVFFILASGTDLVDRESTFKNLCELFFNSISNENEDASLRTAYVNLLSVCQLVGLGDDCPFLKREFIDILEKLFLHQRLGGNLEHLQTTAIFSWSALLPGGLVDDHSFFVKAIERFLAKAESLLECSCFEIRLAAGQALALVSEVTESDGRIGFVVSRDLKGIVSDLAVESSKRVTKRGLSTQHSHFRTIEKSLRCGSYEEELIRIGGRTIVIDCWQLRYRYDLLSKALNPKLCEHLETNAILRNLLHLPDTWQQETELPAAYKPAIRKQINKDRDVRRGMLRDAKMNGSDQFYE